ncbi:MAG: DUF362 domain-containing protein [candidate division Zixibacteria bacterium]|nr:DUF362 domain-containing protein [candidate division Zixibacteria bacterium]
MGLVAVAKYGGKRPADGLTGEEYGCLLTAGLELLSRGSGHKALVKKLFPSGVVGMKISCLAHQNATPPALVDALSKILTQAAGISENNMIIWERTSRELQKAGYTLNASSFGRRFLGTDAVGVGYREDFDSSGKANSRVTRILTDMADHSVNMPILKDHSIAGLSAGMKNMYGAVSNPNKYHGDNCSPYAADVNNLAPIRTKHRLTIIDAIRVQYDNGPGFDPEHLYDYGGLILSVDPVAADRVGLEILEHVRARNKRPSLAEAGREVKYLAAAEKIGLGTADMSRIELRVTMVDRYGNVSSGSLF